MVWLLTVPSRPFRQSALVVGRTATRRRILCTLKIPATPIPLRAARHARAQILIPAPVPLRAILVHLVNASPRRKRGDSLSTTRTHTSRTDSELSAVFATHRKYMKRSSRLSSVQRPAQLPSRRSHRRATRLVHRLRPLLALPLLPPTRRAPFRHLAPASSAQLATTVARLWLRAYRVSWHAPLATLPTREPLCTPAVPAP